jgi:ABC-type uncharacterized transport system involved in gliding motility auxiliary subunit
MTSKNWGRLAGLLGLVLIFSAMFNWFFITGTLGTPAVLVRLVIAVAGIAFWLFATRDEPRLGRGMFYGTVSIFSSVMVIGVLVAANYIAVKKPKSWDLTKEKLFTLSDQTVSTLKGLNAPVEVHAYFSPTEPEYNELTARLDQYKRFTDKLTVELIDPIKHPSVVTEKNLSQTGPRILFKSGLKEVRAKEPSEESLTNAIIEATRATTKKIYFSRGHGERSIADPAERGFKSFAASLRSEGYQLDELVLAERKTMPEDMQMLILAGPAANLQDGELKLVKDWVDHWGRLILMIDPSTDAGFAPVLDGWGIHLAKDTIVDPDSQNPQIAVAQQFSGHPITASSTSTQAMASIYPLARSVSRLPEVPVGWNVVEIARTGSRAWGEMDQASIKSGKGIEFNAGVDIAGPVSLAIAANHGDAATETRLVVFGNSLFAANSYLGILGNRDMALNAVAWVAREESHIAIRPKQRLSNQLYMTTEQKNHLTLFAFDILPFSLLFVGLAVWQTRKSR